MKKRIHADMTRRDKEPKESRDKMTIEPKHIAEMKEAESKLTKGLFPACTACKQIKNDRGSWHQTKTYIKRHGDKKIVQTMCVQCTEAVYPGIRSQQRNH